MSFLEDFAQVDVSGIERMRANDRARKARKKQRKYVKRKARQAAFLAVGIQMNKAIRETIDNS